MNLPWYLNLLSARSLRQWYRTCFFLLFIAIFLSQNFNILFFLSSYESVEPRIESFELLLELLVTFLPLFCSSLLFILVSLLCEDSGLSGVIWREIRDGVWVFNIFTSELTFSFLNESFLILSCPVLRDNDRSLWERNGVFCFYPKRPPNACSLAIW